MDCSPTVQCHWVTTNCYPSSPHLQMMNSRSFEYLFRIAHFYDPWSLTFRSSDPRLPW
jgi:hypothetical protein